LERGPVFSYAFDFVHPFCSTGSLVIIHFDLEYLWEVQVYSIVQLMSIIEIEPLVGQTRKIMQQSLVTYLWHEFFPHGMDFHAK
jgi:hypothetical protein